VSQSASWRDERAQLYFATYRISNLGLRQLQTSRLMFQCSNVLKNLAVQTGELVRLALVEQDRSRLTWVYSVAGMKRSLQIDPNYTLEINLQTHSAGKAWLSTMPFDQALGLMMAQGIRAFTPYSKTDIVELAKEHATAREVGYVISFQENEIGVGAVASPILSRNFADEEECVGVVSLSAPTNRMSEADLHAHGPLVRDTALHLAKIWPIEAKVRGGLWGGAGG
jgi:DNA-binding IclR family transcriptional regulator